MIILGLTGSIAMGKSTVADLFREEGVAVHDADQAVHRLMAPDGKAAPLVLKAFPSAVSSDGGVDRQALGKLVFAEPARRKVLEQILHPLVRQDRDRFCDENRKAGASLVVLDIPLLYETGGEKDCDAVVVVSATSWQQKIRALARPGMTEDRLASILEIQTDDATKRSKADYVVPTSYGREASRWHVRQILAQLLDDKKDNR
ncbi:dephospho-CoA kinase [Alphaproteobacteria bacterium LSUCC0684]